MESTAGIYSISSLGGECLYVGQSRYIKIRWRNHLKSLRSGKHPRKDFISWFEEHGSDGRGMVFKILESLPHDAADDLLNEREIHWFNELLPKFYGKKPSTNERWKLSAETKKKLASV